MFNIGGGEILVILLVALIVLGPQRLPEAARKVGSFIGEVRRMATSFQNEVKTAFDDVDLTDRPTARPKSSSPTDTRPGGTLEPPPENRALGPPEDAAPPPEPSPAPPTSSSDNGQSDAVA